MSTGVAISSVTLSASTSSISFNNIPQTYTDLVLVFNGTHTGAGLAGVYLDKINTDGSTKYSRTIMYGTGSTVGADRSSDSTSANIGLINSTMSDSTFHFMDYANTKTFKTILARSNSASGQVRAGVALWRDISAITSFGLSGVTFAAGSTFSLYGINAENSAQAKATGGDSIYRDASYWYHIFNKSGTFIPAQNLSNVDYVVVAGGGGGGRHQAGGGGGGGYKSSVTGEYSGRNSSPLSKLTLNSGESYTISVGAGGATGTSDTNGYGSNGGNSYISGNGISTITSSGGGGGGGYYNISTGGSGQNGGCGGGGGSASQGTGTGNIAGTGISGQGFDGGRAWLTNQNHGGGGGGGAGASGNDAIQFGTTSSSGDGGDGIQTSITGTPTYFGGGGGGSYFGGSQPTGGQGGGGTGSYGSSNNHTSGSSNTGGGGGGGGASGAGGGNGGSGIIIVRYPV